MVKLKPQNRAPTGRGPAAAYLAQRRLDVTLAVAIFAFTLFVFLISRVHQLADSNYSMLLSQSLLYHQSFTLDHYALPLLVPTQRPYHVSNGSIYQLELVGPHIYYFWPPGSSVLSLPFVLLMNLWGISAANPDGSYNPAGEILIQSRLAALLMAGLAVVFFRASRMLLPASWSVVVTLAVTLGSQIWSTASRALWSETWGIFLLGFVILSLIAQELGRRQIRPVLFASLLAWTYFARPTFALPILAISIYLLLFYRQLFLPIALVGGAWALLFMGYAWYHFGQLLPNYYFVYQHFATSTLGKALLGNLVSPSRGLLVFVPLLLFIAYLIIRYRQALPVPRLVALSLIIVVGHLIVVSLHTPWYGGHCYGPRYSTGVVPWFYLVAVNGVAAWRDIGAFDVLRRRLEAGIGILLLLVSMTINGLGATSHATWLWNSRPINVDQEPERVWDWRHPQFLAAWSQNSK